MDVMKKATLRPIYRPKLPKSLARTGRGPDRPVHDEQFTEGGSGFRLHSWHTGAKRWEHPSADDHGRRVELMGQGA